MLLTITLPSCPYLPALQTVDRFKTHLRGFSEAPWTLQRLCEIVLEPGRQYKLLHKVRACCLGGCPPVSSPYRV